MIEAHFAVPMLGAVLNPLNTPRHGAIRSGFRDHKRRRGVPLGIHPRERAEYLCPTRRDLDPHSACRTFLRRDCGFSASYNLSGEHRIHVVSDNVRLYGVRAEPVKFLLTDAPFCQPGKQRVALPDFTLPAILTVQAAERIALIAETMSIPNAVPLELLLSELAYLLPWVTLPHV